MKKLLIPLIALVAIAAIGAGVYFMFIVEKPIVTTYYSPGDVFVVNIRDTTRLFKAGIHLVVNDDSKLIEKLGENTPLVRDTILFILRSTPLEDLATIGSEEKLRRQIVDALNARLELVEPVWVFDVMFIDYVMQ